MFLFFKILETLVLPPGIFILILATTGIVLLSQKKYKTGIINLSVGISIWALSIFPVSHFLMKGLESSFSIPKTIKGDVIILLGAGLRENVQDLSGIGFPNGDMLGRITTAVRLHNRLNIPIIVTSGSVFKDGKAGAPVDMRILVDLGVDTKYIIIEDKSRNTYENAKYSSQICQMMGYKRPILLTAAYHLKRAQMTFQKMGLTTIPFPAYRNSSDRTVFFWRSFLPHHNTLATSCVAIREYLGILYYKICY
jgi:uncharacterized SAM-binding protein YcdF (DUF218 family)